MTDLTNAQTMNRRTLAKGAAWTLPAIAVAASAPSLAASPGDPRIIAGEARKCPGNSDVPGGFPKHGYVVHLTLDPQPEIVVPVSVLLGNGKYATVVTDATREGTGWSFVVDAGSSPSQLSVTVLADGVELTASVKASPHCEEK